MVVKADSHKVHSQALEERTLQQAEQLLTLAQAVHSLAQEEAVKEAVNNNKEEAVNSQAQAGKYPLAGLEQWLQ